MDNFPDNMASCSTGAASPLSPDDPPRHCHVCGCILSLADEDSEGEPLWYDEDGNGLCFEHRRQDDEDE